MITTYTELKNSNPDLKWEVSRTFNIGITTEVLKSRLVFSANYYHTKVYDMLYPYTVSVPPFKYPKLWRKAVWNSLSAAHRSSPAT